MQNFNLGRIIRKLFLSAFLIITFMAYVLHEQLQSLDGKIAAAPVSHSASKAQEVVKSLPATPPPSQNGLATPENLPSPTPAVSVAVAASSGYKDGAFTGPEVDAYYGLVQVKAIVQNGKISAVQFLNYPHDRRTSQSINSQAMPWLQQEAIQVQSANVDIISGATLTSEAFARSLEIALQSARN